MEPHKIVIVAILMALEIAAAIFLIVGWCKACEEAKERRNNERKTD